MTKVIDPGSNAMLVEAGTDGEIRDINHNSHGESSDDDLCLVCSEDIEIGQDCINLPACSHSFHAPCIIKWLKLVSICCCACAST